MQNINIYQLWQFTFLTELNSYTAIVRNNYTNQIMLRRKSSADNYPVMKTMSGIRHKNLMTVYDAKILDGKCVSLCEYVNGTTLEYNVESFRPYSVKDAKKIMCQICNGLSELHKNRIVHRDIKPSNVMIDNNGIVKIIDFDITRILKSNQSQDTKILGTAGYASPEQFGFAQTSGRADIYACGVLLNYLVTGGLPGENKHCGVLKTIIEKCTEIDEKKRFETVEELKKVLIGQKINKRKNFRPLPGFRGKRIFPKIITAFFIICWCFMLLYYITEFPIIIGDNIKNFVQQIILFFDIMIFWSALPYFLFGDIFKLSEKINPDNPKNGVYMLRLFGILSIFMGFVIMIFGINFCNKL